MSYKTNKSAAKQTVIDSHAKQVKNIEEVPATQLALDYDDILKKIGK